MEVQAHVASAAIKLSVRHYPVGNLMQLLPFSAPTHYQARDTHNSGQSERFASTLRALLGPKEIIRTALLFRNFTAGHKVP